MDIIINKEFLENKIQELEKSYKILSKKITVFNADKNLQDKTMYAYSCATQISLLRELLSNSKELIIPDEK